MSRLGLAVRRNPMEALSAEMERMFGGWPYLQSEGRIADSRWFPVDLIETPEEYRVVAEAPGVPKDAIDISLDADVLSITVRKEAQNLEEGASLHLRERFFGEYRRSVRLPAGIDGARVTASHTDGVLEIRLPKSEQAKPRQIALN